MNQEHGLSWSEIVRLRLITWGAWANGPQMYRNPLSPIAAMIKRAAGELPGDDISVPRDLTFELDVTEKALARMKLSGFPRDRQACRLLKRVYLHAVEPAELERAYNWSPELRKINLWRAESVASRYMIEVEKDQQLLERYGRIA